MGKPRLSGLDALRGIAASAVVLYHVARHLNKAAPAPALVMATRFGHAGVDLFFVLSGFIILFVHWTEIGRPERWANYAGRRFSRVLPTYWVALAATVLLGIVGGHALPGLSRLLWSASLLPSAEEPLLGVAWTLRYELVFYALFCTLILNRTVGRAVLSLWLAIILASWSGVLHLPLAVPVSLFGPCNSEFFFGMAAAWLLRRGAVPRPYLLLLAGAAGFAVAALAEDAGLLDGYAAAARLYYGLPSALLVIGVVEANRAGHLRATSWLRTLGEASYSIYLFQFVFIGVVWQACLACGLAGKGAIWLEFPLLVAAALGGGFALFHLVERPLLGWVRARRGRPGALPLDPIKGEPLKSLY